MGFKIAKMGEKMNKFKEKVMIELFANHKMQVLLDNGINRHLKFENPESHLYWFELISWKDGLTICGDFGSYTFRRDNTKDMFSLFRWVNVNMSYWAEKVVSVDASSPLTIFSMEAAKEALIYRFENGFINDKINADEMNETEAEIKLEKFKKFIEDDFVEYYYSCEKDIIDSFEEFEFDGEIVELRLDEFDAQDFCGRYKLCCTAIQWAINKYDAEEKRM